MAQQKSTLSLYDIVVIGDGLAGLLTTCLMAARGFRCALIAANATPKNRLVVNDARSTAVMLQNTALFDIIGIWDTLVDFSAPLNTIRILTGRRLNHENDFHATDQNVSAFAYNIPNDILKHSLWQKILSSEHITTFDNQMAQDIAYHDTHIAITTDAQQLIRARLAIAADGRHSMFRQMMKIPVQNFSYNQKAMSFTVKHEKPHNNISVERHKPHGPFTLVPLADQYRSNVVWCDTERNIDEIRHLPDKLFQDEMNIISQQPWGVLTAHSSPMTYNLSAFYATKLYGQRTALIGEAAHAVHPLGAQGFNLTIRDIATLDEEISSFVRLGLDIGGQDLLSRYQMRRQSDVQGRVRLMHALTKISSTTGRGMQSIWGSSIALASHLPALRRWVMRMGMAPEDQHTPEILRPKTGS
jgi:2-octaprenyl-6-methoxyphenol hydroxylase